MLAKHLVKVRPWLSGSNLKIRLFQIEHPQGAQRVTRAKNIQLRNHESQLAQQKDGKEEEGNLFFFQGNCKERPTP
jgi:hypothetical protein